MAGGAGGERLAMIMVGIGVVADDMTGLAVNLGTVYALAGSNSVGDDSGIELGAGIAVAGGAGRVAADPFFCGVDIVA